MSAPRTPGPQGPDGVRGPSGPRGPAGWRMPHEQADRMLATVTEALMRDFVFRRPWWQFWRKS